MPVVKRIRLRGVANRIGKVGIELEGGWDNPIDDDTGDYDIHTDSSVRFPVRIPIRRRRRDPDTGEFTEPPIVQIPYDGPTHGTGEIASPPLDVTNTETFVRKAHPQHINDTCGLHVHMSFTSQLNYSRLMSAEFTRVMVKALTDWGTTENIPDSNHSFWHRIGRPDHAHCAHVYCGDKQVSLRRKNYQSRGSDSSRYTALNYCHGIHRTVECRLLPMFSDPEQSIRAIHCVIDTTNKYLSKITQREKKEKVTVRTRNQVTEEFLSQV